MKKNITLASLFILLSSVIYFGCRKEDRQGPDSALKQAVAQWQQSVIKPNDKLSKQTLSAIVGDLDYRAGTTFTTLTGSTVYLVQQKEKGSYLGFYKLQEAWYTIGLISVEDKGTGANLERIKASLDGRVLSPGDYVAIADFKGRPLHRWERSLQGAYTAGDNVVKKKAKRDPNQMRAPDDQFCTDHYWLVYNMVTGQVYSENYMYTECTGGAGSAGEPVYHGSGYYNPGYSTPPTIVTQWMETPCFKLAVEQLVGTGVLGEITKKVTDLYGTGDKLDLYFYEYTDDLSTAAVIKRTIIPSDPGYLKVAIHLNKRVLNIASREFLYSTILHEMIHAVHIATLSEDQSQNDPSHELMARQEEVNWIANGTKAFFPNLSIDDATALAWGGLEKTSGYTKLSDDMKRRIADVNSRHVQGRTGSKCN